jgi:hypothetical protein
MYGTRFAARGSRLLVVGEWIAVDECEAASVSPNTAGKDQYFRHRSRRQRLAATLLAHGLSPLSPWLRLQCRFYRHHNCGIDVAQ